MKDGEEQGILFGTIVIIVGGVFVLVLAAISESIKVLIDIEYNTRKSFTATRKIDPSDI